jgi:hypothetical protein
MHNKLIEIITKDAQSFFGINEAEMFELKMDYGDRYIKERYQEEPEIATALRHSSKFWEWWIQLWARRDRDLLRRTRRTVYGLVHTYVDLNGHECNMPVRSNSIAVFYRASHFWGKVQFYPNQVMIEACVQEQKRRKKETIF